MTDPVRHLPHAGQPWNEATAAAAIQEIVGDAIARFDPELFWPAHPQDDGVTDGNCSVYLGAAGMIWALDYLRRRGAGRHELDFRPFLPRLLERSRAEMAAMGDFGKMGSLLLGDLGTALVSMRLAPSAALADTIHASVSGNAHQPLRELMWGTPGSMLACLSMEAMTGEARWRDLFAAQAHRLLGELIDTDDGPLWTQDLYGQQCRLLGAVHGYAGNMIPLLRGWTWLNDTQRERIIYALPRTLAANARRSGQGISWPPEPGAEDALCQYCHGAPGMVIIAADAPFTAPGLEELLTGGGDFIWAAGPLAKGSNLCHGTGGNGYAFLRLYRRTGQLSWLGRARTFAMTAIAQCRQTRLELGRGRYSLWTGDIGLAVYLADCIAGEAQFPTVDVF